ncbi:RICIN domain-containing protein [Kribbella sp. NPDC003505]|uniref:RICIN domain-containing protein n=1 Tax=Kribbella sp. NPDC003505 TaxID=3154448 RepID=UPI0033AE57FB
MIQWRCATNPCDSSLGFYDQRWWMQRDSVLGGYQIRNVNSERCLAILNGNTTPGVQAIPRTCASDLDQRWWI